MELRLLVAYGLLAVIAVTMLIALLVWRKRREQHRRRMRGYKSGEAERSR